MPQLRIPLEPGHTYHIWAHANGNGNLFRCEDNYRYFLEKYQYHVHPVVETFAYCLMPNHLHLMVRVREEDELLDFVANRKKGEQQLQDLSGFGNLTNLVPHQFGNLFNAYAKAYNKMYGRKGSLFMRPFNRKLITDDEYFVLLIAYTHNNPVHHKFVENPADWFFSSWHAYLLDKTTKINKMEALKWFGTQENFEAIHRILNPTNLMPIFEE